MSHNLPVPSSSTTPPLPLPFSEILPATSPLVTTPLPLSPRNKYTTVPTISQNHGPHSPPQPEIKPKLIMSDSTTVPTAHDIAQFQIMSSQLPLATQRDYLHHHISHHPVNSHHHHLLQQDESKGLPISLTPKLDLIHKTVPATNLSHSASSPTTAATAITSTMVSSLLGTPISPLSSPQVPKSPTVAQSWMSPIHHDILPVVELPKPSPPGLPHSDITPKHEKSSSSNFTDTNPSYPPLHPNHPPAYTFTSSPHHNHTNQRNHTDPFELVKLPPPSDNQAQNAPSLFTHTTTSTRISTKRGYPHCSTDLASHSVMGESLAFSPSIVITGNQLFDRKCVYPFTPTMLNGPYSSDIHPPTQPPSSTSCSDSICSTSIPNNIHQLLDQPTMANTNSSLGEVMAREITALLHQVNDVNDGSSMNPLCPSLANSSSLSSTKASTAAKVPIAQSQPSILPSVTLSTPISHLPNHEIYPFNYNPSVASSSSSSVITTLSSPLASLSNIQLDTPHSTVFTPNGTLKFKKSSLQLMVNNQSSKSSHTSSFHSLSSPPPGTPPVHKLTPSESMLLVQKMNPPSSPPIARTATSNNDKIHISTNRTTDKNNEIVNTHHHHDHDDGADDAMGDDVQEQSSLKTRRSTLGGPNSRIRRSLGITDTEILPSRRQPRACTVKRELDLVTQGESHEGQEDPNSTLTYSSHDQSGYRPDLASGLQVNMVTIKTPLDLPPPHNQPVQPSLSPQNLGNHRADVISLSGNPTHNRLPTNPWEMGVNNEVSGTLQQLKTIKSQQECYESHRNVHFVAVQPVSLVSYNLDSMTTSIAAESGFDSQSLAESNHMTLIEANTARLNSTPSAFISLFNPLALPSYYNDSALTSPQPNTSFNPQQPHHITGTTTSPIVSHSSPYFSYGGEGFTRGKTQEMLDNIYTNTSPISGLDDNHSTLSSRSACSYSEDSDVGVETNTNPYATRYRSHQSHTASASRHDSNTTTSYQQSANDSDENYPPLTLTESDLDLDDYDEVYRDSGGNILKLRQGRTILSLEGALNIKQGRFQCKDCTKVFSQRSGLNIHERIHSNIRPYQCVYCPATFTQHNNKARHERTHLKKQKANKNGQVTKVHRINAGPTPLRKQSVSGTNNSHGAQQQQHRPRAQVRDFVSQHQHHDDDEEDEMVEQSGDKDWD